MQGRKRHGKRWSVPGSPFMVAVWAQALPTARSAVGWEVMDGRALTLEGFEVAPNRFRVPDLVARVPSVRVSRRGADYIIRIRGAGNLTGGGDPERVRAANPAMFCTGPTGPCTPGIHFGYQSFIWPGSAWKCILARSRPRGSSVPSASTLSPSPDADTRPPSARTRSSAPNRTPGFSPA